MTHPQAGVPEALQAVLAGRYEVGGELGRGGMSIVFRARVHAVSAELVETGRLW